MNKIERYGYFLDDYRDGAENEEYGATTFAQHAAMANEIEDALLDAIDRRYNVYVWHLKTMDNVMTTSVVGADFHDHRFLMLVDDASSDQELDKPIGLVPIGGRVGIRSTTLKAKIKHQNRMDVRLLQRRKRNAGQKPVTRRRYSAA